MTFLLWLIETHIQELEEEIKLLKNHSIFVSNKSLYVFVFFITLIQMFVIDSFVERCVFCGLLIQEIERDKVLQ